MKWHLLSWAIFLATSFEVFGFKPLRSVYRGRKSESSIFLAPSDDQGPEPVACAVHPNSNYAQALLSDHLGLSENQQNQVANYCSLILEWNQRINLVSRKECSEEIIFGRHVLPCLSPKLLVHGIEEGDKVVDVGTGGGLPGIPMAICFPRAEFTLIDSVGKKLKAVDDMIDRLGLNNVRTQHSRAEEISVPNGGFDWCAGRSVASLPKFTKWMHHLLKPSSGKLLYIIGGDVPEASIADSDHSIHDLLSSNEISLPERVSLISEKRLLVFPQAAVEVMAAASDQESSAQKTPSKARNKATKRNHHARKKQKAKGSWQRKTSDPKTRGYGDFQRYTSD